MKKLIALTALLAATTAISAEAQVASNVAGNCAISLDVIADIIDADPRFDGALEKNAIRDFRTFSAAQQAIVDAGMAQSYKDSEAFGWDKAKVDEMVAANNKAIREGMVTSTMEEGRLYMDHVMKVNNCAEANKTDAGFGMSRDGFVETLTAVYEKLQAS
ncbi:hypothetical protein [uncultured Algimonas sp.]|uniref:hypothetical protein n=1 Tax=uncultured Algimonas sp. TaxID=1547920 RepID=UPI00262E04CE|nr:hypothetical protein [uncultured Algimonas sp.]